MSLKFLGAVDKSQFARDIAANSDNVPVPGGSFTGGSRIVGCYDGSVQGGMVYHAGLDRLIALGRTNSNAAGARITPFYKLDPFLLDANPPNSDFEHVHPSTDPEAILLGQYNPATGLQSAYTKIAGETMVVADFATMTIGGAAAFTGPNGDFSVIGSDLLPTAEGGWSGSPVANPVRMLVWEGLTNGIPNETIAQGSGVYPDGLALVAVNGTLNGNSLNSVFAWVDLRTRRMVGILGAGDNGGLVSGEPTAFPLEVDSNPAGPQYEGPIAGEEFVWGVCAFYPDGDSSFALPKGRIYFCTHAELPSVNNSVPGDEQRIYIRFTDFNPFGVSASSGQPTRVHGRVDLTTRIVMPINPPFDLSGQRRMVNANANQPAFDPIRGRFVICIGSQDVNQPPLLADNDCTFGFYSQAPEPVIATGPAAQSVPRTAAVTEFRSTVVGDIGELIGGATVNWTLTRRSTRLETLTVTGGIGTTSTVDNPPISDAVPSIAEGTLQVFADGVLLAETTDYTVVLSTGVITWVTDQSGASLVQASYEHRETDAEPAFGTLLSDSSQSDQNGLASTQVRYPDQDSIVGELDYLKSEIV